MRGYSRWEIGIVVVAMGLALLLGLPNLGVPSLWHDEVVHVFVAKNIVETGQPRLPGGFLYPSGTVFNYFLAGFVALFGDSECVVRLPSVLFAALNVLLTFWLVRPLLGRATALVAACALAVSPWTVAWSRQARFYTLQETMHLLTMAAAWRALSQDSTRSAIRNGIGAVCGYVLGVLTALHSALFLAPVGAYSFVMGVAEKRWRSRWTAACIVTGALAAITIAVYVLSLPQADWDAIFRGGRLGGALAENNPHVGDRLYYLRWLRENLSAGYALLTALGSVLMVVREGRRGLFVALAFWAPVLALTYGIGYRQARFMFFVFPFWVAAFSYALVQLARFAFTARQSWWRFAAVAALAIFAARLALSTFYLIGDSVTVAGGARNTLAAQHTQWRIPCAYVHRQIAANEAAILTTSYLPVLYYVGRVDNWYPNRALPAERWESGLDGLRDVGELQDFMREHPSGYFIVETWRLMGWPTLAEDAAWVKAHMRHIGEASTSDVTVYAWGGL